MIIEINIKLGHKCKHYHTDNIEIGNTGDIVHVTTRNFIMLSIVQCRQYV